MQSTNNKSAYPIRQNSTTIPSQQNKKMPSMYLRFLFSMWAKLPIRRETSLLVMLGDVGRSWALGRALEQKVYVKNGW